MLKAMLDDLECHDFLIFGILLLIDGGLFLPILIEKLLTNAVIFRMISFHEIPQVFCISLLPFLLLLVLSDLENLRAEDLNDLIVPVQLFDIE
jgi:hypothetical protein